MCGALMTVQLYIQSLQSCPMQGAYTHVYKLYMNLSSSIARCLFLFQCSVFGICVCVNCAFITECLYILLCFHNGSVAGTFDAIY